MEILMVIDIQTIVERKMTLGSATSKEGKSWQQLSVSVTQQQQVC